jgi:hypothetical protein
MNKLPKSDLDYLTKFGEKRSAALIDYTNMHNQLRAHRTTDNEKYWDEAWRRLQEANEEYEAASRYIIDQFTPADRAAWQAAQAADDQALKDQSAANDELREAESALGKVVQSAAIK